MENKSMDAVCRVCLANGEFLEDVEFLSIFAVDSENVHLSAKIMKCSNKIKIKDGDNFPSRICVNCVKILDIAYKFINQCEQSDETLKSHFLITVDEQFNDDSNGCDPAIVKREIEIEIESVKDFSASEEEFKPVIKKRIRCTKKQFTFKSEEKKDKIKIVNTGASKKRPTKSAKKQKEEEEEVKVKLENAYDDYEDIPLKSLSAVTVSVSNSPKVKRSRGRPKKTFKDENGQPVEYKRPKRLLVCERCGKAFKHLVSLRGHERRHTGEKPFMCSTCGKTFHVPNELRKHTIIHTGIKPYKCTFCERTFVDWGSRLKHERCHLGERPYKCDQCPKAFSYSYVLAKHKLTHTSIKPFICELCKKTFRMKYHLTNHCRKHHGAPPPANSMEGEGNLQIVEDHFKNHFGTDFDKHNRKQKIILAYKNLNGKACEVVMDV